MATSCASNDEWVRYPKFTQHYKYIICKMSITKFLISMGEWHTARKNLLQIYVLSFSATHLTYLHSQPYVIMVCKKDVRIFVRNGKMQPMTWEKWRGRTKFGLLYRRVKKFVNVNLTLFYCWPLSNKFFNQSVPPSRYSTLVRVFNSISSGPYHTQNNIRNCTLYATCQ